jgi:thiol-disulfide isomerase/thioredoxin
MNNFIFSLIILSCFLISAKEKENPFEIVVETSGFKDSTLVYLTDVKTDVAIDSGYIIGNNLVFLLKVDEPTQLIILTDYRKREDFEYKFFWKENRRLTIKTKKGDLKNAKIEGSEVQRQVDILDSRKARLQVKLDSLQREINGTMEENAEKRNALKITQKEILKEMTVIEIDYIKQYPDYLNSAIVLTSVARNIPKEETTNLLGTLKSKIQSTKYGEEIKKYLESRKDINLGDSAVNFKIPDLEGRIVELNQFKNKYILLDFWASWCGPCRKENANLVKIYNQYKDRGFEIIGVNLDKKRNDWENAAKKDGIIWTTVSGTEGDVTSTYNIQFLPKSYLINPSGVIIAVDLNGDKLEEKLREILSK